MTETKLEKYVKINNICLNNQGVKRQITGLFRKYLNANENKNTRQKNSWNAAKTGIVQIFKATNEFTKNTLSK